MILLNHLKTLVSFTLTLCESRALAKAAVRKKFEKIHTKTPVPESLFNKVVGLRPAIVLKNRLLHWCFPINFAKIFRTPFLQNTSGSCFCFS